MMSVPAIDQDLTICLPGEIMRAKVQRVLDRNTVFVVLGQPMARSHNYQRGELVACRRTRGTFGEEWRAIDRAAMLMPKEAEPVKKEAVKMEAKPQAKPKAKAKPKKGARRVPKRK